MPFFLINHNILLNGGQVFFFTLKWLSHKLPIPLSLTQFKRMIFVLIYKINCFHHLLNMDYAPTLSNLWEENAYSYFFHECLVFFLIEKGLFISWTFFFMIEKGDFIFLQYCLLLEKCLSRSFTILGKNIVVTYHQ